MARTPKMAPPTEETQDLNAEVQALRQELSFLRKHKMFVLYQSVPRILFFKLMTGAAVGLGTVVGATFLLSIIVWALSQIEFLPIIGEWSVRIATEIEEALGRGE